MGEAKTSYFLKVSNQVVITFCAAGVALCDIPTCFITCPKSIFWCDRRNTLASLSEDELHFWQQAQHFGDLHRHFAWQAQRRVAASRCVCFFCESHCQGCVKWWQCANRVAWGIASVSFCVAGAVFRTLYTLYTPYTLRSTLYSWHFTLHTLPTLYTLHIPLLHSTLSTLHSTHPGSNLGKGVAPGFLPTFDSKIRQHFVRWQLSSWYEYCIPPDDLFIRNCDFR